MWHEYHQANFVQVIFYEKSFQRISNNKILSIVQFPFFLVPTISKKSTKVFVYILDNFAQVIFNEIKTT